MKRYKIINKFRFFTFIFILTFLISTIFFSIIVSAKENENTNLITICVKQGDTLWTLSSKYFNNKMDIRDYISNVLDINNMKSPNIKPGEIIFFPVY